jgi:hypothetical protein
VHVRCMYARRWAPNVIRSQPSRQMGTGTSEPSGATGTIIRVGPRWATGRRRTDASSADGTRRRISLWLPHPLPVQSCRVVSPVIPSVGSRALFSGRPFLCYPITLVSCPVLCFPAARSEVPGARTCGGTVKRTTCSASRRAPAVFRPAAASGAFLPSRPALLAVVTGSVEKPRRGSEEPRKASLLLRPAPVRSTAVAHRPRC